MKKEIYLTKPIKILENLDSNMVYSLINDNFSELYFLTSATTISDKDGKLYAYDKYKSPITYKKFLAMQKLLKKVKIMLCLNQIIGNKSYVIKDVKLLEFWIKHLEKDFEKSSLLTD